MLAHTPKQAKLIIAAISSRPYVEAAVAAGYEVLAIDAFNDEDTLLLAESAKRVPLVDGQFEASAILSILDGLDLSQYIGFCYGAGFERSPDLLTKISGRILVLGNSASSLEACKNPYVFFNMCERLGITYPTISDDFPVEEGWVFKRIGACGGGHICYAKKVSTSLGDGYFQQLQSGQPIACLFIASTAGVTVIGMHEQWVNATDGSPYRYGGAVSHAHLRVSVRNKFEKYISLLAGQFNLIGLCSCDAIVEGEDVYVLEINPRLSASVDLYHLTDAHLIDLHIRACLGEVLPKVHVQSLAKAHQIIYAKQETTWQRTICPDWVCDRPPYGTLIEAGDAICTVVAQAESAHQAKALAIARAQFV